MNLSNLTNDELEKIYEKLMQIKGDGWMFIVPSSIGETLLVCGLIRAFIKKYGGPVSIVVAKRDEFIVRNYASDLGEIVLLPLLTMRDIYNLERVPKTGFSREAPLFLFAPFHCEGQTVKLYEAWIASDGQIGLDIVNLYRFIMRLDFQDGFERHIISDEGYSSILKVIEGANLKKGKSVIFNVGNNTNKSMPSHIWRNLFNFYLDLGYDVIVNSIESMFKPEDLDLEGCLHIDIPIDLLVPFISYCGNFVSGSNGGALLALASNLKANITILLPTHICVNYAPIEFGPISPRAGKHRLVAHEILEGTESCVQEVFLEDRGAGYNYANHIFDIDMESNEIILKYAGSSNFT